MTRPEAVAGGAAGVLERIRPAGAAVAEEFADPADLALWPEEEALVARSVATRRREFATVRRCARRALAELGHPPVPILTAPRGAPVWPAGVVGSMTHCAGYRAAVLGSADTFATIGVDAEPNAPLPPGVVDAVSLPAERSRIARIATDHPMRCWDRLLFSAKESVYKAWFPLTGRPLDFAEADIGFDPTAGTFTARLQVPGPLVEGRRLDRFHGRFLVARGLALTLIAVHRADAALGWST